MLFGPSDQLTWPRWRRRAVLLAFIVSLVHGFTAGTDSELPVVQALYIGADSVVIGARMSRFLYVARRKKPAAPPAVEAA
jgi:hypothetical protein